MSKCVNCGHEILTGDIHWEMGLCNNCYNELYKDHKTHISLDKRWLKLAQDFRDENEKLQDKIADIEAQIAEMQNKSFILYSTLYETLEKQSCDNVASQIDQMTGWTYDKEVNWLKGNRNYDQLKQSQKQLAISELEKLKEKRKYDEKIDTLEQQLKNQPAEIVEKIKEQIFNHFNVKNIEEYERLSLLNALFTADAVAEILDDILKEYQK